MKINTPLGEYPFEFRGIERRGRTVVVRGTVAGLESSAILDSADLSAAARSVAPGLALAAIAAVLLRRAWR